MIKPRNTIENTNGRHIAFYIVPNCIVEYIHGSQFHYVIQMKRVQVASAVGATQIESSLITPIT